MGIIEIVPKSSVEAEPAYSGCTTDVGSGATACPTSSHAEECMILSVHFIDPENQQSLTTITHQADVELVVQTQNLEGEIIMIDLDGHGGHFTYQGEPIGDTNYLMLSVGSAEEHIPLGVVPKRLDLNLSYPDENGMSMIPVDTTVQLLVTAVNGPQEEELEADIHYEFSVASFNRGFFPYEAEAVQWAWKIPGGYNVPCVGTKTMLPNGYPAIQLSWNPNFIGSEVIVMAYMHSPTEDVSARATIATQRRVKFYDTKQRDLFSLVDDQYVGQRLPAKEFFSKHANLPDRRYVDTQWFEPMADNYKHMISVESGIESLDTLKHFTWKDVADFADINRGAVAYKQGGSGDWKNAAAGGFGLVTVNNQPFRADAVGQIPFTVECFKMFLMKYGDTAKAIRSTLKIGMVFGKGDPWAITLDRPDQSETRQYDNFFVLRGLSYVSKLYTPGELYQSPPTGPDGQVEDSFYTLNRDPGVDPNLLGIPVGPIEQGWITDVYARWDEIEAGLDVRLLEALVVAADYWNIPYCIDFWKNWLRDF